MRARVNEVCPARCGVRVAGELDVETREFIHRFVVPESVSSLVAQPLTESQMLLVTFGPEGSGWALDCPVCRARIEISPGA